MSKSDMMQLKSNEGIVDQALASPGRGGFLALSPGHLASIQSFL